MINMENIIVKPQWITDLDQSKRSRMIDLILESIKDEGMLGFEEGHKQSIFNFVDDFSSRLSGNSCWLLQAEIGNELAYSVIMERWGNPTGSHIAELKKAIVNPKFRGNGLVLNAIFEILKKAEIENIDRFVIDVREGTRAEKLWRSLGFKEFGRIDDYSRYKGNSYRGVYMTALRSELLSKKP